MPGLQHFHRALMAWITLGSFIYLIFNPIDPQPGKQLMPLAFGALAVMMPFFIQPVLMVVGGLFVLSFTGLSWMTPASTVLTYEQIVYTLTFLLLVVCAPLAYPIWDEEGNDRSLGPNWFWVPPLVALPVAGLLYAGSIQPTWIPLGIVAAALVVQAIYGFVLDAKHNKALRDAREAATVAEA